MGKFFGTDGIRGVAGAGLLSPESVLRLGRALGHVLNDGRETPQPSPGRPTVLIGRDSRLSGPTLEASLSAGLLASGVDVVTGGLLPTPGVQLLTKKGDYDLGVIVSASHNPYRDNGIKVVGSDGEKLGDELEQSIETSFEKSLETEGESAPSRSLEFGRSRSFPEASKEYGELLTKGRFSSLSLGGSRIVLDCANGAASEVAPRVLSTFGAEVITIHNQPDGTNINRNCGALHPEVLQAACKKHSPCIGITLDGDADRALMVSEDGEIRDGDHILGLVGLFYRDQGRLPGNTVVATIMSNIGLERALANHGIDLVRTPVGDRHVVQKMRSDGFRVGGEQSGHVVFDDGDGLFGDGLVTALRVLEVVGKTGQSLTELAKAVPKFPQVIVNVEVRDKPPLHDIPAIATAVSDVESALAESGRVVLRYSGTEPLARVMLEGPEQDSVQRMADQIAEAIRTELGA